MTSLRVSEIFHSIQGESLLAGVPTTFVRLTGCPLRCHYCDTSHAFSGGEQIAIPDILATVKGLDCHHVTVTGGEPLAQKGCWPLLMALCDQGHTVSLETAGAISIEGIDPRVIKVLDIKTPDSGECERNLLSNFQLLSQSDQIKFVVCSKSDYQWAKALMEEHQLNQRCSVLFSPSFDQLPATELADWLVADRSPARLQLQLHKLLWGAETRR